MEATMLGETLQGQVFREPITDPRGGDRVFLRLSRGERRVLLSHRRDDWSFDLEIGSLLEVTGDLRYLTGIGEFAIEGNEYSHMDGPTAPEWRILRPTDLEYDCVLPGVNDQ